MFLSFIFLQATFFKITCKSQKLLRASSSRQINNSPWEEISIICWTSNKSCWVLGCFWPMLLSHNAVVNKNMGPFTYLGSIKHRKSLGREKLHFSVFFPWLHNFSKALSWQLKEVKLLRFVSPRNWTQWVNCDADYLALVIKGSSSPVGEAGGDFSGAGRGSSAGWLWQLRLSSQEGLGVLHWASVQTWSLALNFWSSQLRFSTQRRSKVLIFRGFRSDDSLKSSFAKMPFLKDNLLPLVNQTSLVSRLRGWGKGKILSE